MDGYTFGAAELLLMSVAQEWSEANYERAFDLYVEEMLRVHSLDEAYANELPCNPYTARLDASGRPLPAPF